MSAHESHVRITEIEVGKSTLDEKIIGIFRYEPEGRARGSSGKRPPTILLIAEVSSTLYIYEQLLDAVNGAIEHLRPLISGVEGDPMARFEKLIQRLNEAVAAFTDEQPTPISWNRVNLFIMEFSEWHVCLSGIGRLSNIFLQKQSNGGWKGFDLFGSLEQPVDVDPKKLFSALICGDIHPGDILFAGTQNFERIRQELGVIDRLKSLPPVTAAMEIKQDLESSDIPDDFAGVIVACVELPTPSHVTDTEPILTATELSKQSVERMHEEEQKTQAILSPTITPLPKEPGTPRRTLRARWAAMRSKAQRLIREQRARKPARRADALALASLRGMSAGHGDFFSGKRKRLVIFSGVGVLTLLIGILWFRHARAFAAEQTLWNISYNQILDRKNRADADLIIGNEDRATRDVQEARDLLTKLDERTTDRKKTKDRITQDLFDLQTKLRHEIRLDAIAPLFSLPAEAPMDSLATIVVYKSALYSVDSARKLVMRTVPGARESSTYALPINRGTIVSGSAAANGVLFLTDAGSLIELKPEENKILETPITMTRATGTRDFTAYIRRLYLLDPGGNMIWRYAASGNGYTGEAPYLKQNTHALTESTAIAIDSNVYVGFRDGRIVRYYAGIEDTWTPTGVDPPLSSVASIWTSPDTDRIAIADHDGKRIVVLNKEGHLIAQILSSAFKGPSVITGDEKTKKLYLIDTNRVFSFDLP